MEIVPQLTTADGRMIVAEIRSQDWNQSRILAVAGGSLLTNYALTRPLNRQLAEKIVVASKPSSIAQATGRVCDQSLEPVAGQ